MSILCAVCDRVSMCVHYAPAHWYQRHGLVEARTHVGGPGGGGGGEGGRKRRGVGGGGGWGGGGGG